MWHARRKAPQTQWLADGLVGTNAPFVQHSDDVCGKQVAPAQLWFASNALSARGAAKHAPGRQCKLWRPGSSSSRFRPSTAMTPCSATSWQYSVPLPRCLGAVSSQRQSGKASVSHMMCGKLPSVCRRGAAPKMQRRLADQVPHTATRSRTAQVCMNGPWTAGPRGQERAGITTKGKRELRARAHLAQQVLVWMLQVEP